VLKKPPLAGKLIEMEEYFSVAAPGSFGGVQALYRLMKQRNNKVSVKQAKQWLAEQDAYNLHKPARKRFPRRKIYSRGIDYLWQGDLADVSHLAEHNNGFKFLLTVIDVFSKFTYVRALRKKDSKSVIQAFDSIFADGRQPMKLQTDKGKEFLNSPFQIRLKELRIQFYVTQNDDIKASVVERFNRTLKVKMWKYFTHNNTYKYTDILQDMVYSYNHSYHRTIGRTPASVTKQDEPAIRARMYGPELGPSKPSLTVGTKVRIAKARHVFTKGYLANWTTEIFTISQAIATRPPTYRLHDYSGELIDGAFYEEELQRIIKNNDVYKIEKILKTRQRRGKKEYFVKWLDYPDKFNYWVAAKDMSSII
jgi:hypothetical protein